MNSYRVWVALWC